MELDEYINFEARVSGRMVLLDISATGEENVTAFFDYIERIIENRTTFTMESFAESVDRFLEFNEYKILEGYGSVSRKQAEEKAFAEYDKFNKTQRIESDFDKAVKQIEASSKKGGNRE